MRDNGQRRQFLLRPGGDGRMLGLMDQRRGEETEEGAGRKGGTEGRNSQFINRHKREEMTEDTCQITSATTLPLCSPRQDLPPQIRGFPPSASATLLSIFLRFSSGGWCRVRVTRNTTKKKREKVTLPHPYLMFHPHREQIWQNQTGGITRRQQKENTSVTQSLSHSVGVGAHVWFTSPPRFLKVDLTLKAKDLRVQHIKAGVFPAPSEVEGKMVFWFRFYPTTT